MFSFLLSHTPLLYFTQSIWRDEAFSILVAEKPISFFFGKLTFEPPLYYILLHFWIKIFGESEIVARSLSLLAFALATVVIVFWAEKLFHKHWLSWFLPVFFFLNPMLLYYAFEVRTYGWYIFFATVSMYSYMEKKWRLYVASTVLGFYTHSFFLLLPVIQGLHYLLLHKPFLHVRHIKSFLTHRMGQSLVSIALLVSPWLFVIAGASAKLASSWYFPVDFHLIRSVVGNMFFGYEGTPPQLWPATAIISLLLLALFLLALKSKATRSRNTFFFLAALVPLAIVIGISFLKPMFVNRYLIFVTVAEVFLVGFAIETIRNSSLQKLMGILSIAVVILANIIAPSFHKKVDIRKTIVQINALTSNHDVIFAATPLILFESEYYSKDRNRVFLYNPDRHSFPWYVGDAIFSPSQIAYTIPSYPTRAFLVKEDGTFTVVYQIDSVAGPRKKTMQKT